jgi:peptidoglycan/LPS O-acetylase OafA/YrhL
MLVETTLPETRPRICSQLRPAGERLQFIDALRGIAALAVACYHIHRYGPLHEPASQRIPWPLAAVFEHGWMGVQVFFVISGFVIAYSVLGVPISPRFLGNFALRRSIRLDPPYWATILLVLALYAVTQDMGLAENVIDPPHWRQLASHAFYLQDVLDYGNVSVGFWSLCIEVQFYLLLIVLLGVAQWLHRRLGPASEGLAATSLLAVTGPLALASLVEYRPGGDWNVWILHFFCMFFLGALGCWALTGRIPRGVFWCYVALLLLRLRMDWSLEIAAATLTGVTLYLVGRLGRLADWLSSPPLQYLGKISYSLYLIHYPISWIVVTLGFWLTGDNSAAAIAWLCVALAASIGAAHLLHRYCEAPSIRLARRLKPLPLTNLSPPGQGPDALQPPAAKDIELVVHHIGEIGIAGN